MKTWQRILTDKISTNIQSNKALLIFGARRVGKTILIRQLMENFDGKILLLNGEDADAINLLENKSIANYRMLLKGVDLLVIDEAQQIPDIGLKIKLMLDEVDGIRIIASGSSSFDLLNKAGEPLVGRSYSYQLSPFSQAEIASHETVLQTKQNVESRLIYGSYPEVVMMDDANQQKMYLKEIVNAYLLKDILQLDGLRSSAKMKDLLTLLAYQCGSEVSLDELGKQLGLSRNTVEKQLDLLTQVFVLYRLKGFSRNLRKEVAKSSKWYFCDNGIRNALIGNFNPLATRSDQGLLWENYLISERIKKSLNEGLDKQFFFWRTYDQQEIDLIELSNEKMEAFEFKWGSKQIKAPNVFLKNYPQATFQVLSPDTYLPFLLL